MLVDRLQIKFSRSRLRASIILALVANTLMPFLVLPAHAATFSRVIVRFDRMKQSTGGAGDVFTTGTVCAEIVAANGTEASVKVTFPTGMTVSTTTGHWTTSTTNLSWPSGASAWPTIGATASSASGQDVTWSSGNVTSDGLYCFNWTNSTQALKTNTSTGNNQLGTVTTQTSAPAPIDTGDFSTSTIGNDQITVTATVNQTFSFALSGTTDALGTLGTGAVSSSPTPRTATVNTNAKNGWQAWARDTNAGLNSSAASYTINSTTPGTNSTLSAGTEGYNMGVTSSQTGGSGTISIAAPFVGNAAGKGGGLDTALRSIATSTGTANNAVLTLTNNAAISPTTAAASDYTDVITVVAAGMF